MIELSLASGEISLMQRYLPQLAVQMGIKQFEQNFILRLSLEDLENLQDAVVDVLSAYGFDENYDANALGQIAENLIDKIQNLLEP